ncbi:MAG TPA: type II/IV secretion system ATPase subunit [Geobacterales bacterium]|nr:type II/IV secretion system ATPase subunit [Geobacterales bacterium]
MFTNSFFSNYSLFKINRVSLSNETIIDEYRIGLSHIFITANGKYLVEDPPISDAELNSLRETLEYLLFKVRAVNINDDSNFEKELRRLGIKNERSIYFLKREIFGFGALDPLVKDPKVEDVQVPSPDVPARVVHSDYDKLVTNVVLDEKEINLYAEKFAYRSGKSISAFKPLLSIRTSDTTRVTLTYKKEVGLKGSSITIRKFPERPWSMTRLLVNNTIDPWIAAWSMLLIEHKKAILVYGGMGCGKTSLINALANCINERATIITVEDTPEIRLAHPYWIPLITRESLTIDEKGNIDMFMLVKHALRMSGDYLVVGEVRGEEGKIWAQAIMTGHGGLTTFHAESHTTAIERLLSEPIKVDIGSLSALHALVGVKKYVMIKEDERGVPRKVFLRRVSDFFDFEISLERKRARFHSVAKFNSQDDSFKRIDEEGLLKLPTSKIIMEERGWDEKKLLTEIELRYKFFSRLKKEAETNEDLLDYRTVTQLIWKFYENPKSFETGNEEHQEGLTERLGEEEVGIEIGEINE